MVGWRRRTGKLIELQALDFRNRTRDLQSSNANVSDRTVSILQGFQVIYHGHSPALTCLNLTNMYGRVQREMHSDSPLNDSDWELHSLPDRRFVALELPILHFSGEAVPGHGYWYSDSPIARPPHESAVLLLQTGLQAKKTDHDMMFPEPVLRFIQLAKPNSRTRVLTSGLSESGSIPGLYV